MQMYVAHTYEIDDPQDAVQDIMQALPLEAMEGKNAVGIITTHTDAVTNGVIAALAEALPFDFVGMSVLASCGDNEADIGILTLVVLVSEENTFATAISSPLRDGYKEALDGVHGTLTKKLGVLPTMAYVCAPFSRSISGQDITSYLTNISDNMPLFGGLASTHMSDAEGSTVFCNAEVDDNAVAMVYISGPLKTHFAFASLDPDELQNKKALITASEGNIVFTVNDMPVMNYMYSLGLSTEELTGSGTVLPFLVDYHDGSPLVAREVLGITPEKHVTFGGEMPTGSSIYIAIQTAEDVLGKARNMLELIQSKSDTLDCVLVVGCAGRSVILGGDPLGEARDALQMLDKKLPYHQNYSRGEICPVTFDDGRLQNRYHNFTFTVCMFEKA